MQEPPGQVMPAGVLVTEPTGVPVALLTRPMATVRVVCPEIIVADFPAVSAPPLPVAVKVEVPVVIAVV